MMTKDEYLQHGTDEYDECFEKAGIRWYPWVGRRYPKAKVKIMILGRDTYQNDNPEDGWNDKIKDCAPGNDVNRILALGNGLNLCDKKCRYPATKKKSISIGYYNTTRIFLEGAGTKYEDKETRKLFWESVVFANFFQCSHPGAERCLRESRQALTDILKILTPDLCVAWSVQPLTLGFESQRYDGKRVRGKNSKFTKPHTTTTLHGGLVAGILHPSRFYSFHSNVADYCSKWLTYLRDESPPKYQAIVQDFLEYLSSNKF